VSGGFLSHLECPRCGARHDATVLASVCVHCGSPLLARYDLAAVARTVTPAAIAERPPHLWRYRELLPAGKIGGLGEGWTPLVPVPRYGQRIGVPGLLVKDEAGLPTGSFKARGAAVGVARAAELGVRHIAMPTNGNAGMAWAAFAAQAGLRATIAIPAAAPLMNRLGCLVAGADVHVVDGLMSDAGALIRRYVAEHPGVFDVSTLREPYRIEGKKTMGLEIVEQLGWSAPDVIVYPTGGGVGLIGIQKAIVELRELGWLAAGATPRLVAVQSTGCAPIVRAFQAGVRRAEPWVDASTVAFGITVPAPLGDELILDALAASQGTAVAVDDEEILKDLWDLAHEDGLLCCPEGAAGLTAVRLLRRRGWLTGDESVVVLNTGSALTYPDALARASHAVRFGS
jgi:threonine synthase